MNRRYKWILGLLVLVSGEAVAANRYVSPTGSGSGTESNPMSLAAANAAARAGDTVYLKGGQYRNQTIRPSRSGAAGSYITYKAYNGANPVFMTVHTVVDLTNRNYIVIDGIHSDGEGLQKDCNIRNTVVFTNTNYSVVQNCNFKYCRNAIVHFKENSHHNKVLNNRMDYAGNWLDDLFGEINPKTGKRRIDGNVGDLFVIDYTSHHNLVEGNHLSRGGHNVITIEGYYNIIRNNFMDNDWSSDFTHNGEGDPVDAGYRVGSLSPPRPAWGDSVGHNLFENNRLTGAKTGSGRVSDPPCFTVDGKNQIFRKNMLYGNLERGIVSSAYSKRPYSEYNKLYNNVLYNHGGAAFNMASGPTYEVDKTIDNIFINNISHKTMLDAKLTKGTFHFHFMTPLPVGQLHDNQFISNSLVNDIAGDANVYFWSPGNTWHRRKSLAWFNSNFPGAHGNISEIPIFAKSNPSEVNDFRLLAGSPQINKGAFLSHVTSATGSGTRLTLDDAGYFCDGYGLIEGDFVQLEGDTQTAQILSVNYQNNVITLNKTLSWNTGQGISLPYSGNAPDMGAHEYQGVQPLRAEAGPAKTLISGSTVRLDGTGSTTGSGVTYLWTASNGGHIVSGSATLRPTVDQVGLYQIRVTKGQSEEIDTVNVTLEVPKPANRLEAHWTMDTLSGSTLADSSGNGHTATVANGASVSDGKIANALTLDGSNDYATAGNFDVIGSGLTIATWIKPDSFGNDDARILSKATGTEEDDHTWMVSTFDGGKLRFRLKTNNSTSTSFGSTVLPLNTWTHVAATYDGSRMRLYVNGVEETDSVPKSGSVTQEPTVNIRIGDNPSGNNKNFDGQIDDMRIYNYGLTSSQINDVKNAVEPVNQAPTANAGANQTVTDSNNDGENVTLDGTNSSDVDGTVASYSWKVGGSEIATGATPTLNLAAGTHTIDLTVTDNDGASSSNAASVNITVQAGSNTGSQQLTVSSLSASAGQDIAANTTDGDLSTRWYANGDGVWIEYELDSAQAISEVKIAWHQGNQRAYTFSVEVSSNGNDWTRVLDHSVSSGTSLALESYIINVASATHIRIVGHGSNSSSNGSWTSIHEVEIWGSEPEIINQAPTANAGANQTVTDSNNDGENVTLDGTDSSDVDGTVASYSWKVGGSEIATGATPTLNLAVGTHTINLTVTDNDGASSTNAASVVITVNADITDPDTGGNVTLDFDNLGAGSVGSSITIGEYLFAGFNGQWVPDSMQVLTSGFANPVLRPGNWSGKIEVSRVDGELFSLEEFQHGKIASWADGNQDVIVTGHYPSSADTVTSPLSHNGMNPLGTTILNWSGLEWLTFDWAGGVNNNSEYGVLDNLLLSSGSSSGGNPDGLVNRDYWTGISGVSVTDLTNHANYPDNPTGSDLLGGGLEALGWDGSANVGGKTNWGDSYGQHLTGYIIPATSGNYTFWIASDDHSQFSISSNESAANLAIKCSVGGWTSQYLFTKYSGQKSAPVALIAGQPYYFEVLQKEHGGGDHVSVAWSTDAGITPTAADIVPASVLSSSLTGSTLTPLGFWPLDGNADDVSGNNRNGSEVGNPTYPAAQNNTGLRANGDYITVESDPFDGSTFTLMTWINPDNVSSGWRAIIEKDRSKPDWYGLFQNGNRLHIRWSPTGTATPTTITLVPGVFSHVAATFDGTSVKLYVNGVLKHTGAGTAATPTTSDGQLRIGINGSGGEAFQGIIDEVKIFAEALDATEIQAEMN